MNDKLLREKLRVGSRIGTAHTFEVDEIRVDKPYDSYTKPFDQKPAEKEPEAEK